MTKNDILDNLEEYDPRAIQESFEYRMLLTLFWVIWSVKSFYDGTVVLGFVIEESGRICTLLPHKMEVVYEDYLIGILTLGMAVVIFMKSEHRISYLFSFLGIMLFLLMNLAIDMGAIVVFVPILGLLFLRNLRACLICYLLSSLLFLLILSTDFRWIGSLFFSSNFLLSYALIFMSAITYRARLFPLNKVIIKLRYRLYLLLAFLPFALGSIF